METIFPRGGHTYHAHLDYVSDPKDLSLFARLGSNALKYVVAVTSGLLILLLHTFIFKLTSSAVVPFLSL